MLGTFANVAAVIVGGVLGLLLKKGIPLRLRDTIMKGIALCTIYIGVKGSLNGINLIITIISMVLGAVIGELLDLDGKISKLAAAIEKKFHTGEKNSTIAEGFLTASLLFCIGAMTIVGALESGLTGNHEMLFTKSVMDGISSIILASTLGVGVVLSAGFVLIYQGGITLIAGWAAPYLTDIVIAEMTCVGSILIIGLGLNMLDITKLKVMNYLPAIFIPIILCQFI